MEEWGCRGRDDDVVEDDARVDRGSRGLWRCRRGGTLGEDDVVAAAVVIVVGDSSLDRMSKGKAILLIRSCASSSAVLIAQASWHDVAMSDILVP